MCIGSNKSYTRNDKKEQSAMDKNNGSSGTGAKENAGRDAT